MKRQRIFFAVITIFSSFIQTSQPIIITERQITSLSYHLNGTFSPGSTIKPIPSSYLQALQNGEIVTFSLIKTNQDNYYTLFVATPSQPLQGSFLLFAGVISPATSTEFEITINNQKTIPIPLINPENPQKFGSIVSIQAAQTPIPPISAMDGIINLNNLAAGLTLSTESLSADGDIEIQSKNKNNIQFQLSPESEGNLFAVNNASLAATDYIITAQAVNISGTLTLSNNSNLTINGNLNVTANTSGYFINIAQGCTLTVTGNIKFNGASNNFINAGIINVTDPEKSITITGNIICNTGNNTISATTTHITGYLNASNASNITINGTMNISQPLNVSSKVNVIINGNLFTPSISLSNGASVTVKGKIGGSASINSNLTATTLSNNATLTINGSLETASLDLSAARATINGNLETTSLNLLSNSNLIINNGLSVVASTTGYFVNITNNCAVTVTGSIVLNGSSIASLYNAGTITATNTISIFNNTGANGYTDSIGNATSGITAVVNYGAITGTGAVSIYNNIGGTGGNAVRQNNIGDGNFGGTGGFGFYNTGTVKSLATLSIHNNQGGTGGSGIYGGNGGDAIYNGGTLISNTSPIELNANNGGAAGINLSGSSYYNGNPGIPYSGTGITKPSIS